MNENPPCTTQLTTAMDRPTTTGRRGTIPLYELTAEWQAVQDAIEDSEGELTELVEHRLAALDCSITEKVQGIITLIRHWEGLAKLAQEEAARLRDLAASREAKAAGLKAYLLNSMVAMDRKKIETPIGNVSVCKNSRPSIRWVGFVIPEEYQKVEVSLDGTKAYEDWKKGELPDGFEVVTGQHLRIK